MDYTESDVAELTTILTIPELDCLTVVRMARADLGAGLVDTAVSRLKSDVNKIRPINLTLYNIVINW